MSILERQKEKKTSVWVAKVRDMLETPPSSTLAFLQ